MRSIILIPAGFHSGTVCRKQPGQTTATAAAVSIPSSNSTGACASSRRTMGSLPFAWRCLCQGTSNQALTHILTANFACITQPDSTLSDLFFLVGVGSVLRETAFSSNSRRMQKYCKTKQRLNNQRPKRKDTDVAASVSFQQHSKQKTTRNSSLWLAGPDTSDERYSKMISSWGRYLPIHPRLPNRANAA